MKTIDESAREYAVISKDKFSNNSKKYDAYDIAMAYEEGAAFAQKWISVEDELPNRGMPVIGLNEEWINEDFNPNGTRECFISDMSENGWVSSRWNASHDCYITDRKSKPTHWRPIDLK